MQNQLTCLALCVDTDSNFSIGVICCGTANEGFVDLLYVFFFCLR